MVCCVGPDASGGCRVRCGSWRAPNAERAGRLPPIIRPAFFRVALSLAALSFPTLSFPATGLVRLSGAVASASLSGSSFFFSASTITTGTGPLLAGSSTLSVASSVAPTGGGAGFVLLNQPPVAQAFPRTDKRRRDHVGAAPLLQAGHVGFVVVVQIVRGAVGFGGAELA